jgi:autotransporter-associated beta strand protein
MANPTNQVELQTQIDLASDNAATETISFTTIPLTNTLNVQNTTAGSLTLAGDLSGAGAISVSGFTGGPTLTFTGALTQTGGFTVADASNVTIAATGSYDVAADGIFLNGGTFTNQGIVRAIPMGDTNAVQTSTTVSTTVVNAVNARIEGSASGVIQLQGGVDGALTVSNAGLIRGIRFDGVTQHGTGALLVTNDGTGVIYGQNTSNSVTGYGVGSDGGGALTLTNAAGGTIVGQYGVVGSNAADQITNAGTIASGSYTAGNPGTIAPGGIAGVQLRAGGTITNQAGGVIDSGGRGVSLGAEGTIVNQLGATIRHTGTGNPGTGAGAAVYANGNLALTNAGRITTEAAGANDAVTVQGVATVTNTGGLIQAVNASGLALVGAGSSVTNSGTIQGGTSAQFGSGVAFSNGGTVTNQSGGLIQGGARGITSNAALTLTNLGTISGTSDGVGISGGASSILNSGTISSTTNFGVAAGGTGATLSVTNARGGTINGGSSMTNGYGLGSDGQAMTVNNYGSIGGQAGGIIALNNLTLTANLYAGSVTGSIRGSGGNDTVSLYTGTGTNGTGATTTVPVTGQTVVLQAAGTNAAATVGTLALGGGTNTLNLRGTGDGTAANGASGTLGMATVSGLTTLNKQDAGTFVLTGGYNGALTTNVTGGRAIAQNTGSAFGTGGTVTISANAVVELNNTTATTILQAGNTFNGAGTIAKTGTGRFDLGGFGTVTIALDQGGLIDVREGRLAGSNNFQGIWTNNRGSLNIESGATFDGVEGTIRVDRLTGAGTLQGGYNGTRTTTVGVAGGSGTFSGIIKDLFDSLALTKEGLGTQTLSGANTYTGLTTISAGTLVAANASALGGTAQGTTVANGGNLTIAGAAISAEAVTLNGGAALTGTGTASLSGTVALAATSTVTAAVNDTLTLSGVVSGTGGLTKGGAGTLILTGTDTYTGGTTISAGTLQIGAGGTTGSITGAIVDNGALVFNRSDAVTFGGVISGSGTLQKLGAGVSSVLTLTAAETYTGTTTVSAGTLLVNGSLAAGSAVTVAAGAILGGSATTAGTGTIAGTVAVAGTISAGTISTVGILNTGALTLGANAIFHTDVTNALTADRVNVTGAVNLAGLLDFTTPTDFSGSVGQNLILIANDATDTVTGRFTSLRLNGTSIALENNDTFSTQGHSYLIDYRGGDGNDVAIRDITPGPAQPTPTPTPTPTQPAGPTPQPNNAPSFGETVTDTSSPVGASAGPVYALYKAVLGRTPDPLGLESFTTAIQNGASLTDVANALLGSPEGASAPNAAADPNGFVQSLYQKLLGRAADASGLQTFTGELAAGVSAATVVVQLATSDEAQSKLAPIFQAGVFVPDASESGVARLYYGLLGRAPDANGLKTLTNFVENGEGGAAGEAGRLNQTAAAILTSTEYAGRNPSGNDATFVNNLYQGALGRAPEAGGVDFYLNQIAQGVSRATVALEISQSPEAQIHLVGVIEGGFQLAG